MSKYPEIQAGQRLTAGLLSSMLPEVVVKPTTTGRASTTAMTTDPDLQFTGEAGAVYLVEFNLMFGAVQTADVKTEWQVPSDASGLKNVLGPASDAVTNSTADSIEMRCGVHNFVTDVEYAGVRDGNALAFGVRETGVVTLVSAGTIGLNWAQLNSDTTATNLFLGSYMAVRRLS